MANEQNLTGTWQPGQSGNPAGRTPGSKNLGTIIRELMENPPDWTKVNIKDTAALKERYKNSTAGEALAYVAYTKALVGDVPAMNFLRKTAYGEKVNFEGDMKFEGMIVYVPEQYPMSSHPSPSIPKQPLAPPGVAPLPVTNPNLDGMA